MINITILSSSPYMHIVPIPSLNTVSIFEEYNFNNEWISMKKLYDFYADTDQSCQIGVVEAKFGKLAFLAENSCGFFRE